MAIYNTSSFAAAETAFAGKNAKADITVSSTAKPASIALILMPISSSVLSHSLAGNLITAKAFQ
ncbi:MAG: hypothetical protein MUO84_04915, partial [Thermoplasmata archaeon]|nr:hypothetical protein [Thermoplasmata archaeon]